MAIAKFDPEAHEGSLAAGFVIKRGTLLRSQLGRGERTACTFSTAQDVRLLPLTVVEARYFDFPLAYGEIWPATDAAALQRINLSHPDVAVTAGQIHLHLLHRLWAVMLLGASFWMTRQIFLSVGPRSPLGKGILVWQGLLVVQALLGASTVWTGRATDITTLHVVVGAVCLSFTVLMTAVASRLCCVRPTSSAIGAAAAAVPHPPHNRPSAPEAVVSSR